MPYEVVKTIGGRPYRYRVVSRRDPESGRVKNTWTYLGKAEASAPPPKRRSTGPQTRTRLIAAFLALVEREPWSDVTPGAIAREAGLAPGTFYRHFRDRLELFALCTEEANAALDRRLAELAPIADDLGAERARVREWAVDLIRRPTVSPGLMRVWSEVAVVAGVRAHRRAARVAAFAAYIGDLRARGLAPPVGPVRPLAIALSSEVESLARRESYERTVLTAEDYEAAAETFDRLLFWRPPE
jgi:AcrR family transcriptional regulator